MAAVASARQELPHLSSAMDTSDDHTLKPVSNNVTKLSPSSQAQETSSSTSASTTSGTTATSGTSKGTTSSLASDHAPPPPPPPPAQETPGGDYFSFGSRFDQEPNPFEQSFLAGSSGTSGVGDPLATPKAILPPVTSITSPAPLLPGSSGSGVFWGPNSLRSGPLSPAMLQGPAVSTAIPAGINEYHIRTGLTPNESGIRSGLTPGGSGTMFNSAPSPASQLFQQFVTPGVNTPGTMEFKKTALSAAVKNASATGAPGAALGKIELPDLNMNDPTKMRRMPPVDAMHDPAQNAAANGLYLLAQAQTQQSQQPENQYGAPNNFMQQQSLAPSTLMTDTASSTLPNPKRSLATNPPGVPALVHRNGRDGPDDSDDDSDNSGSDIGRSSRTRNGRRSGNSAGSRRKAEDSRSTRSKKSRTTQDSGSGGDEDMDDDKSQSNGDKNKKMTDEEKRRNFLERNRVAALKCRQRKKQWLASLQKKVELYTSENDALNQQVASLREELVALKTLLIAHKDCPGIPQLETLGGLTGGMPIDYSHVSYQLQPNVMAPPGTTGRRFS